MPPHWDESQLTAKLSPSFLGAQPAVKKQILK
jgi:hypothetical protein